MELFCVLEWGCVQSGEQGEMETAEKLTPVAEEKDDPNKVTSEGSPPFFNHVLLKVQQGWGWPWCLSPLAPSGVWFRALSALSPTEQHWETERDGEKKENNLTPNLFKGSQRPDVPCFLPAAAAVAIACGCGLSVWSSDVRDWNFTGNSPQLGGCSSAAAPDSRACKDPALSQSQRLCFCWARVADVQKRCSALKI